MAERIDTLCREINLTFQQVCKLLADVGLNFEVKSIPHHGMVIKITATSESGYNVRKSILDNQMLSYSTGHDTTGYFFLILADNK